MSQDIPCKDCICFSICKNRFTDFNPVLRLSSTCKLLDTFITDPTFTSYYNREKLSMVFNLFYYGIG